MSSRHAVGAVLLLVALAVDVAACYVLAGALGARNDLFPRWLGTRLWLTSGQDLYSAATDDAIRAALGPPPLGDETFVFGFVYPAYVAFLLAPLALLPFRVAATLWLQLIQAGAVSGALLAWRAHERERGLPAAAPSPALVVAAVLPATVLNLLFLQFAALACLGLAASWWLLARERQTRAAVMLLLASVKPQLALLPAIALLLRAVGRARWRFVLTASVGAALIGSVSLLLFPGWIDRFVTSTQAYAREAQPTSAAALLTADGRWVVSAVVVVLIAVAWWWAGHTLGQTLGAAALLSVWLVPPLYEWNSVVLLLVLAPALRQLRERGARACWLGSAALVGASVLTLWAMTRWPSESRLVWPTIGLAVYLAASRLGSHRLTSSAPAPSVSTRV